MPILGALGLSIYRLSRNSNTHTNSGSCATKSHATHISQAYQLLSNFIKAPLFTEIHI